MKKYIKPDLDLKNISLDKELAAAGLSGWLETNIGGEYGEVITTFEICS